MSDRPLVFFSPPPWVRRSCFFLWLCMLMPVLTALLSACNAVAPGMHFDRQSLVNSDNLASKEGAGPRMQTITPALVLAEQQQRDQQAGQDIRELIGSPPAYVIQNGDILSIVVWDHPELAGAAPIAPLNVGGDTLTAAFNVTPSAGFSVDHEGMIQFPFAGKLKIGGLTEQQARTLLAERIARYINKPDVTLRVQSYRSKRIYIDGEVKMPGAQAINDIPMTLVEAVHRAGGFLPSADQSQIVINRGGQTFNIDLQQMLFQGISPASIMLTHGDVVRVKSREQNKVFVSGEVMTPKSLLMHDGRLTLNEALGEAGGINPQTGDGRQVYVIRNATDKQPQIFHLDTRSPAGLSLAEEFPLRAKDVVYVDAAPLATWHRVISLIFPSALSQVVQANNTNGK